MKHNYRITIERTNEDTAATMQFEFEDREDMFTLSMLSSTVAD